MPEEKIYNIGIKLTSDEDCKKLISYSYNQVFWGLDFEKFFEEGYPSEYPVLAVCMVDVDPFGFGYSSLLRKLVDAGFLIQITLE